MKNFLLLCFFILAISRLSAQDTLKQGNPRLLAPADTSQQEPKTEKAHDHKKSGKTFEREKTERRKFDSTLFTTASVVTRSDYLESMEKVFQILSQVPAVT